MISYLTDTLLNPHKNIHKTSIPLLYKICLLLIAAFLVAGLLPYSVQAASGIKIYDNSTKKTTTYSDKQVKVTFNGKVVGSSDTPGILVDGIALVSYSDVFDNSGIAADCVYDKKDKLSITKYGITISMTIGSKVATVNGKTVTLPVAPKHIKYLTNNQWKILVPSRFVAESLGLEYNWQSELSKVSIVNNGLHLAYSDGNCFEYLGALGKVTINGKNIDLEGMPSIITNNTAMIQAKKVFADSEINAVYAYNKKSQSIIIKKGDNVLNMTIGSAKATLNNKTVNLDAAPLLVTNYENNSTYVMVPGNFTATSLGYTYTWNSTTKTSVIKTNLNTGTSGNSGSTGTVSDPVDSGANNETGNVINEWKATEGITGICSEVHELNNLASTTVGNIYYASRDNSNNKANSETFQILSSSPFGKVTASNTANVISIDAVNMSCIDQTYQMYGVSSNYVNTLRTYNNTNNIGTRIDFEVLPENYHYDISFSSDYMILYVTIYQNALTSVAVGKNTAGDYLTLTGSNPLSATITKQVGLLSIDLPRTVNNIGDFIYDLSGTQYIKQITTISSVDKTQFILAMNEGYTYYSKESGNQYTIFFQKSAGDDQSEISEGSPDTEGTDDSEDTEDTDTLTPPEIPIVKDISCYEIVIPRPEGLELSNVSNEDYYFNNYFVIRLKGDYKEFFDNNTISNKSSVIDKISVTVKNNVTEIKIATKKLQGYAIAADDGHLYVNIGDPKEIYKNIIVLDPGHGGAANGATYYSTDEKNVNFKILYTLGKKYFYNDPSKLKVYYTRTSDVDLSLSERAAFASKVGADLFVSLHMNAADDPRADGSEVFYALANNTYNKAGLKSQILATTLLQKLLGVLGTDSRGVKDAKFTVIYKNTVPAVLIELGFLSNLSDYSKITNDEIQDNVARTIYETILEVFDKYPTGR